MIIAQCNESVSSGGGPTIYVDFDDRVFDSGATPNLDLDVNAIYDLSGGNGTPNDDVNPSVDGAKPVILSAMATDENSNPGVIDTGDR